MRLKKVITTAGLMFAGISSANAQLYMCQSCPTGTWSDGTLRECKNCLTTGVAACNSTTGKVTSCKAGYGYSNGSCSICAAGKYSAGGTAGCSPCPAGTYSSAGGATSCKNCLTTSVTACNSTTGKATSCKAGYALSNGACLICLAGTYSSAGATSCKNCLTTGVAACSSTTGKATSCKAGYGLSNGTCSICPAGTYSAGGTASCSSCPSDYYQPQKGQSTCLYCDPSVDGYKKTCLEWKVLSEDECDGDCSAEQICSKYRVEHVEYDQYVNSAKTECIRE